MIQRLALILPLAGLTILVGTLVVIACQPDPSALDPKVVILPCAAPKSLIVWLELEQTSDEQAGYAFGPSRKKGPPFQPVAYYAASESPANLIAERVSAGTLRWGPKAIDTEYGVLWRGLGEVHIRVPDGSTEAQLAEWTSQLQRCEPGVRVVAKP